MRCGLLGRKLGHSYSPQIHRHLGSYSYEFFEKEPEEVAAFLKSECFDAINVTIPYKQTVIPYLDELSPLAQRLGAVNTIVRRSGKLIGHNTDYYGFRSMVENSGLLPAGKKCLIIGSGGVSKPARAVLEELGAQVIVISHKENTPETLKNHADAAIIVNATPVGMYPHVDASPVDLSQFPELEGVLDLIFNPSKTELMRQAQGRGLVAMNGLWMLVAQAKEASEWFTESLIDDAKIAAIHRLLRRQMENIILIGMPGCGKTTTGTMLAQRLSKQFVDADAVLVERAGRPISQILPIDGEEAFRQMESEVLASLGMQSGLVIATGGGCVTKERNEAPLRRNGTVFWLKRDLDKLPSEGRPLSQSTKMSDMYRVRKPMYERFADHVIQNDRSIEHTVAQIQRIWEDEV